MTEKEWRVIASAPQYEINRAGEVRSIKTGTVLKPWKSERSSSLMYKLRVHGGYHIGRSQNRLLAETFTDG